MRRAARLAVPVLLLASGALALQADLLEAREALLVAVALEALLLAAGAGGMLLVLRRFRERRAKGVERWRALEEALSLVMPGVAARLIVTEQLVFWCLLRWALGRRTGPARKGEFGYHRRSSLRTILPLVILLSPAELGATHLLAHLLSPWPPLKWVLLALGVYALLWLAGLYASLILLPHRMEEDGLRLRYGAHAEVFVPYAEIEEVEVRPLSPAGSGRGLFPAEGLIWSSEEGVLLIPVGGKTDLSLRLRSPLEGRGLFRSLGPAAKIRAAADEPSRRAEELRRRLAALPS